MSVCEYYNCSSKASYRAPVFEKLRDLCSDHLQMAEVPSSCDYFDYVSNNCTKKPAALDFYDLGRTEWQWRCRKHSNNYYTAKRLKFKKAKDVIKNVALEESLKQILISHANNIDLNIPMSLLLANPPSFLQRPKTTKKEKKKAIKQYKRKVKKEPEKRTDLTSKFGDFGTGTIHI